MFAKIFGNVSKESILWQKIIHRFTIFLTSRKWSKKEAPPCLEIVNIN